MRKVGVALGAIVVVLAGLIVFALMRTPTEVSSSIRPGVTVLCDGSTSMEACGSWGDAILADGAPSFTFDMEDLARLELSRSLFGFGSTCEAAYFTGRNPDDAVWTDVTNCPPSDADN